MASELTESIPFETATGGSTNEVTVVTAHMGKFLVTAMKAGGVPATIYTGSGIPSASGTDAGYVMSDAADYMSIRQANGIEFSALKLNVYETGNWSDVNTIIVGYKDGVQVGKVEYGMGMANSTSVLFDLTNHESLDGSFAEVDEIRIMRPNSAGAGVTVQIDRLVIEGSLPENNDPVISGISGSALKIAPGKSVAWPSVTISDEDDDDLTVTITATGVTVSGLIDEDSEAEGIQLTGTAGEINDLLADATFSAAQKGSASIEISVDDGRVEIPVTGTIILNVQTPGGGGGSKPDPKPDPKPNIVHTDESGRAVDSDNAETFVGEDDAVDAVTFSGSRADYTITRNEDGSFTIKGSGAADTLQSIERLHFNDGVLALDVDAEPGLAFRLYQAAFGREADEAGLGFWIERLDDGEIDLLGLAQSFIQSDEFESLYGSGVIENLSFIELLYENILGRGSEDEGFAFWQQALEDGATFDWLLAVFSESAENVENIAPLIADGIWYQL